MHDGRKIQNVPHSFVTKGKHAACAGVRAQLLGAMAECELHCQRRPGAEAQAPPEARAAAEADSPAAKGASALALEVEGRRLLRQQRWTDAAAALRSALAARRAASPSLVAALASAEACGGLPTASSPAVLAAASELRRLVDAPDADADVGLCVKARACFMRECVAGAASVCHLDI